MTSTANPAVVILHAAWHSLLVYYPLLEALVEGGYDHCIPHLRSCNNPASPSIGLKDDAAVVRRELHAIRTKDPKRRIIMLMHSYGAVVGSEALNPRFGLPELPGGLDDIYLVYLAVFMPSKGNNCESAFNDPTYPIAALPNGATIPRDPGHFFFNGLSEDLRKQEAKKIVKQNGKALMDPVTYEAWREVGLGRWNGEHGDEAQEAEQKLRIWFVVFEDDRAIPQHVQRGFVEAVREEGALVREISLKVGHSPFRDEKVVGALMEVLKEVEEEME